MEQLSYPEAHPPVTGAEALFDAYADMIYRLAFLRTKSAADADDVVQEVFLRCLKTPRHWQSAEHQKAWLITVTLNCTKSLLTTAFRRHTVPEREDIAVEMQEKTEVYGQVMRLPVRYRTVVHLFYYEGYKVAEIARIMGATEGTVKSWLFRARDMLRESLKGVYPDV